MDERTIRILGTTALRWRELIGIKDTNPDGGAPTPRRLPEDFDWTKIPPEPDDQRLLRLTIRDIGWGVFVKHGRDGMIETYEAVYRRYGSGAARRLDRAWELIGGWVA